MGLSVMIGGGLSVMEGLSVMVGEGLSVVEGLSVMVGVGLSVVECASVMVGVGLSVVEVLLTTDASNCPEQTLTSNPDKNWSLIRIHNHWAALMIERTENTMSEVSCCRTEMTDDKRIINSRTESPIHRSVTSSVMVVVHILSDVMSGYVHSEFGV
ncbi:hypothetical protein ACHAWU_003273 [Discostella pseudostelligera]|uniref:Uncharacterized protein n=1 Tax=Discostella pseudostelligera TaxID=259834 RepID=A0ABD3MY50_9STRA